VVSGSGKITQSGVTTTINQISQDLSLSWTSFNIAAQETVDFIQPSANSVAINRILGNSATSIFGHLNANGQVFLINPNGILFGPGADVDVGGLVASTLDLLGSAQVGTIRSFGGSGTGSVINQGTLNTAQGGYVALTGNRVFNEGTITATLGTVALAGASAATLTFNGDQLVHLKIDQSTLNNLAENRQLIQAGGGQVFMTAGAKNSLLASVVNNTGLIEAQTVENHGGVIMLLGGMQAGIVEAGGTLDASAPNGGNGGFIETSGSRVEVASKAQITTDARVGKTGTWLIDPNDFTIAATGGDETGAQLSAALTSSNVVIESSQGATAGSGNVNVNDLVSWSANTTLTLTAANNINVNANITATGNTAGLVLSPNTANGADAASGTGVYTLGNGASITLSGNSPSLVISAIPYTVINSLGVAGSTSGKDIQGMNGNLAGHYALGSNIDASTTSGWNSGAGFTPIGTFIGPFTGVFDGLGHTITNLYVNQPLGSYGGLFGYTSPGSILQNIGLVGANINFGEEVGALVGVNYGTINNAFATGNVNGSFLVGGLVGVNYGTISNAYATAAAGDGGSGLGNVGGLVGSSYGTISNSYATGTVYGGPNVGGLVGSSYGTISNSYAAGAVDGGSSVGGLVGFAYSGAITDSYATGSVSGTGNGLGGLVGVVESVPIANVYATGNVTGASNSGVVGGLVGSNFGTISNAYAIGSVSGTQQVGGLVGSNGPSGSIANTYATGSVTILSGISSGVYIGGLVGINYGDVASSYWDSTTTGQSTSAGGTPLTSSQFFAASSFGGFTFGSTPGAAGWVIVDMDGSLNNAGGALGGTRPMLVSEYSTTVSNAHQLQLMALDPTAAYTLSGNVDASPTNGPANPSGVWSSAGFIPIGNYDTTPFSGSFDGRGFTINNVFINQPTASNVGLFGYINSGSIVQNVGLVGASVSGLYDVGALAGSNYGTITRSYATGSVVTGSGVVGGLVGANLSTLANSSSASLVIGSGANENELGGLVGENAGAVTNSSATGSVLGNDEVGGLVGTNDTSGVIASSFASGAVNGAGYVGGLAGLSGGTISSAYASGTVEGYQYVGGLVGYTFSRSTITDTYAIGAVSGTSAVGGLVGINQGSINSSYATGSVTGSAQAGGLVGVNSGGTVASSYWDTTTTGQASSAGGVPLTDAQFFSTSSFAGFNFGTTPGGSGWVMIDTDGSLNNAGAALGGTRPMLLSEYSTTITNAHQLQLMELAPSASYTLAGNIDASATNPSNSPSDVWGSAGFIPIGTGSAPFSGTFDGLYQRINALFINLPTASGPVGLFGETNSSSIVRNVYLSASNVTGATEVGALVGLENGGTISASYVFTGNVNGSQDVGGLVGYLNNGSISNSGSGAVVGGTLSVGGLVGGNYGTINYDIATGSVTGVTNTGGLVGSNYASITNYTALGNVTGGNLTGGAVGQNQGTIDNGTALGNVGGVLEVGGLVGENDGTITASYASGGVTGTSSHVGGLVGLNYSGSISLSSATGTVSGVDSAGGLVGDNLASITNSYATGSVSGNNNVGGLAGANTGTISSSYATGPVSGLGESVGGLVGFSEGPLSDVYATGSVTGGSQVGGLAGYNAYASISNAYATGSVNGTQYVGGLVGYNDTAGTVTTTYATGAVTGGANLGGLVGYNSGGPVISSYWDMNSTGQSASAGGTGLTTAAAMQQSSYSGFDFTSPVWVVYSGYTYPLLTSFMTPLTITASDLISHVYNGAGFTDLVTNLTYSDPGALASGNLFGSLSYNTGKNVGTYTGLGGVYSNQQGYLITVVNDGSLTITPLGISVAASGTNKVYDGTVNDTTILSSTGLIAGDVVSFVDTSSTFADANVGNGKIVSVEGITATGADAGNYTVLNTIASTPANIAPAVINLSGTQIYNGTTSVASGAYSLGGLVDGQTLTLSGVSTISSKNVGSYSPILGTLSLGDGTGLASNYTLSGGVDTVSITPASLTLAAVTSTRTYNGTTTSTGAPVVSGLVAGDSISDVTESYDSKNAGARILSVNNGYVISDGNGGDNYTITTTTATGTITPLAITVTAAGNNRVYNGTTADAVTLTSTGIISGDVVDFVDGSATFANKNVGTGKKVSVTGIAATGTDAGDYTLTNTTATTSANVTPLPITVTAIGANKVYNGTTADTVTLSSAGIISGDVVHFADASATFSGKNVGTGLTVTVAGITDSGSGASNYTLINTSTTTTANITPLAIKVTAAGTNEVYNGTTLDAVTLSSTGILSGDIVGFTDSSATFGNKNVGTGKTVTVSGISLTGANAGDYTANATATTTASITPKPITVTATGVNKVYNGTTADPVILSSSGVIAGDTVTFTDTSATFPSKNVGTGLTVTVLGIGEKGANASDYTLLNTTATTTANITPATLTYTATPKTIVDGKAISGLTGTVKGFVTGDTLANSTTGTLTWLTNAITSSPPGTYYIDGSGLTATNYIFVQAPANATALTLSP
jgi:filamentous hemagglutinin family protein